MVAAIESEDDSVAVAICGAKGENCLALDVIFDKFDGGSRPVASVWTCDSLLTDASKDLQNLMTYQMIDCETQH